MRCKHCKAELREAVLGEWLDAKYVPHSQLNCLIGMYSKLRSSMETISQLATEKKVRAYANDALKQNPEHKWSWEFSQNMESSDGVE